MNIHTCTYTYMHMYDTYHTYTHTHLRTHTDPFIPAASNGGCGPADIWCWQRTRQRVQLVSH